MWSLLALEFAVSLALIGAVFALVVVALLRKLRNGLDYLRKKDEGSWIGS